MSAEYPDWENIESAPEDELILISATPDWVGTAFYVFDEDSGRREWFWGSAKTIHENIVPIGWMPLPEFLHNER